MRYAVSISCPYLHEHVEAGSTVGVDRQINGSGMMAAWLLGHVVGRRSASGGKIADRDLIPAAM